MFRTDEGYVINFFKLGATHIMIFVTAPLTMNRVEAEFSIAVKGILISRDLIVQIPRKLL